MNKKYTIAGIDDATKCPCIGSIFIAGVVADQKTINTWKRAGVKDSKLLTRKKREQLALMIKDTAHTFSIQEIKPAMIDDKTLNLNEWEMAIVLSIMDELKQKSQPKYAYIDNWETSPILFWERWHSMLSRDLKPFINKQIHKEQMAEVTLIPEHQADAKYVVVGAASILAKTSSDYQYDEYKKIYGNFGSGSPGDPATRLFVWKHRKNPPAIIRKSWQTYKVLSQLESIEDDYWYARKIKIQLKKRIYSHKLSRDGIQQTLLYVPEY